MVVSPGTDNLAGCVAEQVLCRFLKVSHISICHCIHGRAKRTHAGTGCTCLTQTGKQLVDNRGLPCNLCFLEAKFLDPVDCPPKETDVMLNDPGKHAHHDLVADLPDLIPGNRADLPEDILLECSADTTPFYGEDQQDLPFRGERMPGQDGWRPDPPGCR